MQQDPFEGLRREALAISPHIEPWEPLGEIRLVYPSGKVVPITAMTHARPPNPAPAPEESEWVPSKPQRRILLLLRAAPNHRLAGVALERHVRRGFHDRNGRGGIQELMKEGLVEMDKTGGKAVYALTEPGAAEAEACAADAGLPEED